MKDVRGIVFDLFGTLTDGGVERDRENLYGELARVLGVSREDFSSVMRQTFHERCVGSFGSARQTLARLCAMLGARVDDDTLDAAVRLRLEIERVLATPRGESVALLHTLRDAGFSICLISDCGCETPEIWGSLPFATLIDDPVFSCQVGLRKPHPALRSSHPRQWLRRPARPANKRKTNNLARSIPMTTSKT